MTLDGIDADLIEPHRLAACVIDELRAERRRPDRVHGQRGLSARDTLIALRFEAAVVAVSAGNLATGMVLCEDDYARLMVAWARIEAVLDEVAK